MYWRKILGDITETFIENTEARNHETQVLVAGHERKDKHSA